MFASSDIRLRQTDLKVKKKGKKSSNKMEKKDIQGYESFPKPLAKIDSRRMDTETDGSIDIDTSAELQDSVKTFDELIDEDFDYTKIEKCSVSPGNVIDYMTFAQ